jgi:hypothetical protein
MRSREALPEDSKERKHCEACYERIDKRPFLLLELLKKKIPISQPELNYPRMRR